MFRRFVLFVLLVLAASFMVPEQLQAQGGGCSYSACISIVLKEQCMNNPNSVPPLRANNYWLAEVIRSNPWQIAALPHLTGGGIDANNDRWYTAFLYGAIQTTQYQMHRAPKSGPDEWSPWTAYMYATTGGWGSITTFTTYHFNYGC